MKKNVLLLLFTTCSLLSIGQSISTSNLGSSSFCMGESVQIDYSISGSFVNGNTFYVELSDASGSFSNPDTIGSEATTFDGNILAIFPAPIQPSVGYRVRVVSDNPVVTGSNTSNFSLTGTAQSDTIFGNNLWNVYAYEANYADYKGYYQDNTLGINTQSIWPGNGSPSDMAGFEGCSVVANSHQFVYKREGFPCGYYTLDVRGDDSHRIYLDGNLIYSSSYTPNIINGVWSGYLTSTSKMEIQVEEFTGISQLEVHFNLGSGLTITPDLSACAGETIKVGVSGGTNYDWSSNTTNVISGTNSDSITISIPPIATPGSSQTYSVQANDPNSVCVLEDSVKVTVSATASVSLSSYSGSICTSNNINVTATGTSSFLWLPDSSITYNNGEKSNVTIHAQSNATYKVTGNGACASDTVEFAIIGEISGDPSVYGDEEWIVYGYNGNTFNTYRGFYTDSDESVASRNQWNHNTSPSEASNWQGCDVDYNQHSFIMRRKGFTCGIYQMDIPYHDDQIIVEVDGQTVYTKNSWYSGTAVNNVWQGYLGEETEMTITIREGIGESSAGVTLNPLEGPAVNANHTIWNGETSSTWTTNSNWCGGVPSSSDTAYLLNKGNAVSMSSDLSVGGLFVENGVSLNVGQHSLFVYNKIENNGNISVSSGGNIIQTSSSDENQGSGIYSVERTSTVVEDNTRYNFWSMPFTDETVEDVFPASNVLDFYTFTTGAYSQAAGTITPGVGFTATGDIVATYPRSFTRTFTGNGLNNGDITVTGLANGSILLGNPYPSGLDLDAFAASNSNLSNDYYFWDHNTYLDNQGDNSSADWAQYNVAMGAGTQAGSGGQAPQGYIASAQGFFATKNSGNSVTFSNSHRSSNNSQFYKTRNSDKNLAWFNLTNSNEDFNQILIGVLPTALDELDGSDGEKLSVNPNVSFYSVLEDHKLGIQGVSKPIFGETKSIELAVVANVIGTYSIELDSTFNWPVEYDLYLIDMALNKKVNMLTENSYSFEVHNSDTISQRFYINMTNTEESTSTRLNTQNVAGINVYQARNLVWIDATQSNEEIAQVELVSVTGKTLKSVSMQTELESIDLSDLAVGVYIVRVKTTNGYITKKIVR